MNTGVVIKANSHGIRVILNSDEPLENILKDIRRKLYSSQTLLKKNGNVYVSFEGRKLNQNEINLILDEMNSLPDTGVSFVCRGQTGYEQDMLLIPPHTRGNTVISENAVGEENASADYIKKICKADNNIQSQSDSDDRLNNLFYYGNLENGQTFETNKSVIIIGDVCKNARVISQGNIIVLGKLSGTAIAGRDLKQMRFVLALNMEPVHIKIGRCCQDFPRHYHKKAHTNDAMIAYCENGKLVFNLLSQTSL